MSDETREFNPINRRAALRTIGGVTAGALAAQAAALRAQAPPPGNVPANAFVNGARWSPELHAKAESFFVLDGVAHCYNHSEANKRRKGSATKSLDVSSTYHEWSTPAQFRMNGPQYNRDWQPEEVMDVMFLESPTDMIVMHSVPIYDNYWDGLVSNEKGAFMKGKYPDRVLWYGAVDGFDTFENAKTKIDQLVTQNVDGIKLYPTRVNIHTQKPEGFLMDDEKAAYPIFEYALSKGVKHIGVHKLVGYTADQPALGINDLYKAAAQFPDVVFHLVHGGWMLVEETAELMRARENVTAVLEGPMIWPHYDRERYDAMWKTFMTKVDVERVIYASTSPNQHPYWIVNDFVDYEPPKGSGFRVTDADKAKILGLNLAAYHGINVPEREARLRKDRFWKSRMTNGYREPYIMQRHEVA